MTVVLGDRCVDTLTGYEGTVIAVAHYLAGHTLMLVTRADSSGKPEEVWIPDNRLEQCGGSGKVGFGGSS